MYIKFYVTIIQHQKLCRSREPVFCIGRGQNFTFGLRRGNLLRVQIRCLRLIITEEHLVMAYKEVYRHYFGKLIKCLPMDDSLFLAMLSEHELLPGDTEGKVRSLTTQTEKATYFISHVIKPSLEVDSRVYFDKLLLVMTESGYKHVEEISSKIKSEIPSWGEGNKTSMLL